MKNSILKSSKFKECHRNKSKEKEKEKENKENKDNSEKEKQIKENEISDNFDKELSESLEKEKQLKIQKELEKAELNNVIKLLKLEKDKREKNDIKKIKDYLCNHIDYFKNLLEQSEEKLMKLIPLLNFKTFKTNERIMNFGEEGDKCYILLKGVVGIYKPFPITKQLSLREYVEYLANVRDLEKNMPKFDRILNYNSKIDKIKLFAIEFDYTKIPQTTSKINIMLEEERELGQAKAGASFGEMALIKNQPRNASIIALERCGMIYIEKNDYTKIVKDIEEQRINRELATFKQFYPIFRYWPPSKCFRLLSGFITQEYDKDEYVYKQNDVPTGIYIIKEGIFEVYTKFNFNWYEEFINYIHDTSMSLMNDIDNPMKWKEDRINKKISEAFKNNTCPFHLDKPPLDKIIVSHQEEDNENIDIAKDIEGEISQTKKYMFKANIQKLFSPNNFGFLEVLELKTRICSVKCISQKGILLKFPLLEFLQLLPTDKRNQFYMQQKLFEEKRHIIAQLKNNALTKLDFMKNEKNKIIYIKKDFFKNNNNKPSNVIDFRKKYIDYNLTPMRNIIIGHDMNSIPKLYKSKSSINYNTPKIKEKSLISYKDHKNNDEYTQNDDSMYKNESYERRKHNSKNGIILGFKNSVIKLTKDKMEVIKGLFPFEQQKRSFSPNLNIKQIDNSDSEYIKYLEDNILLGKSPSIIRNVYINEIDGMAGKNFVNYEIKNIIKRINKDANKNKNSNSNAKSTDLILPKISSNRKISQYS